MSHRCEVFSKTTDRETAGRVSHGAATTWTRTQATWRINNRWTIAIAGEFLQIALGAAYASSVFRVPVSKQCGGSMWQMSLTFTISIFVLGFAAFFGGLWMNRKGPRVVALTGATLY